MALLKRDPKIAPQDRPRVVVLGAGFAGLHLVRKLRREPVDICLIDRNNYHLFQPLLYQVATAGLDPSDISVPIRSIVGHYDNVRVLMAEARRIDRAQKKVILERRDISYDYLVVATGARVKYFGPQHWREHSIPLKRVEDAMALRRQILTAFEYAEQAEDRSEICEWLTFVIIGAGPTGVEMAGAIREIATEVMRRDFDEIDPADTRVVLIDALPHILASYPEALSEEAKDELESRDIEVWVDSPVDDIGLDYVRVGDRTIATHTVVWAAGVEPSGLIASLDTELDEEGYVRVGPDLSLADSDCEFAVGDAAHFFHHEGDEPLPALAPVAIQQGKHVAKNIRRRIDGRDYEPFEYRDRGQMSTIGRAAAVAEIGPYRGVGFVAWLLWLFVHLLFLIGFKNRLTVLIEWIYSYLVFKRGARIIIADSGQTPAEQSLQTELGRRGASESAAQ